MNIKWMSLLVLLVVGTTLAGQRPVAVENGKIWKEDGKKWLWGGEKEDMHFDITNCTLDDDQFHYGIGREAFPALIEPAFIDRRAADELFKDDDRFLLLEMGTTVKAYSIKDLTRHEVVNDEVEGQPIMAAYCILADLGAIYDRMIGGLEFTFALSGYTYYDPEVWDGMDGFVMWDRETESLWWPLIGKAVSGKMLGTPMKVLDEKHWEQTTWGEIKARHDRIQVLEPGQDFDPPENWRTYEEIPGQVEEGKSVAPRWGENSTSGNKN
ncbi:MAG: DUF3179 domain-containing (seleno)protein [Saprospiraceae bacterium]|nr:DUF3179 domain-containing (seleno)protein [Saprospiraceae bacterium]